MARIYTKTGDDGTTGVVGGKRVSKDSPLIEASGSLDELNAIIGIVRTYALPDGVDSVLQGIQDNIFTIGTQISAPRESDIKIQKIGDGEIEGLEHEIDSLEARLPPLKQFILPGGAREAAQLHLARTAARKAERRCVTLSRSGGIDPRILRYLNRLSDLLFLLARHANQCRGVPELDLSRKRP